MILNCTMNIKHRPNSIATGQTISFWDYRRHIRLFKCRIPTVVTDGDRILRSVLNI